MANSQRIEKPNYDHIQIGDRIIVTEWLKECLTRYQNAPEEANIQNITERMAMAAVVVEALRKAPNA